MALRMRAYNLLSSFVTLELVALCRLRRVSVHIIECDEKAAYRQVARGGHTWMDLHSCEKSARRSKIFSVQ